MLTIPLAEEGADVLASPPLYVFGGVFQVAVDTVTGQTCLNARPDIEPGDPEIHAELLPAEQFRLGTGELTRFAVVAVNDPEAASHGSDALAIQLVRFEGEAS